MIASIIIPTFKRHDLLLRALAAACQQLFPADEYEVVVADDAECPATRQLVESMAASSKCELRYVPVLHRHGPAAARNCGWREARGDILAFTDDDCIPDPLWLASGVRALLGAASFTEDESRTSDEASAVKEVQAAWGKLVMPIPSTPTDYERDSSGLANATFVTANCFVKREALAIVGGFDEQFRLAWREDTDLYFRLLEHGMYVRHVPQAIVVHPVRPARWGVSLFQQAKSQFDVLLYRKHPQLYRNHIPPFPFLYVLIVGSSIVSLIAYLLGAYDTASLLAAAWIGLTARFAWKRLRGTSHSISHLLEMLVTSIAIPWLAIFYRIMGYGAGKSPEATLWRKDCETQIFCLRFFVRSRTAYNLLNCTGDS